jgi:hypothetical protein
MNIELTKIQRIPCESYEEALRQAAHGDRISLGSLPNEISDFDSSVRGVTSYVEGQGFSENGILTRSYNGKIRSWVGYGPGEYLALTDTDQLLRIWGKNGIEIIKDRFRWKQVWPHYATNSVVVLVEKVSGEKQYVLVGKYTTNKTLQERAWRAVRGKNFNLLAKELVTKHVRTIWNRFPWKQFPTDVSTSHPDGPAFFDPLTGNITLVDVTGKNLSKRLIHKVNRSKLPDWSVTRKGVVLHEIPLRYNEDPDKTFFNDQFDKVIGTVGTCVIIQGANVYLPFEKTPIATIPHDEAMRHPDGVLFVRSTPSGNEFVVLVIRPGSAVKT